MVLLEVSLLKFSLWIFQGDQRESKSVATRCINDELHSSDIQRDQMEDESWVTRSIIDELHSCDIEGVTGKMKVVLLEVSLMKFILGISKEIKWKVKVVLLEV